MSEQDLAEFLDYDEVEPAKEEVKEANKLAELAVEGKEVKEAIDSDVVLPGQHAVDENKHAEKKDERIERNESEERREETKQSGWAAFAAPKETGATASEGEDSQQKNKNADFSALLQALGSGKEDGPKSAVPVRKTEAIQGDGVMGSRSILVTNLTDEHKSEDKLRSHFIRYGEVEEVACFADECCAFVRFKELAAANRSFVNRAPVLKDQHIQLFRVADFSYNSKEDRDVSRKEGIKCPNRVVLERSNSMDEGSGEKAILESGEKNPNPEKSESSSLYSNISLFSTSAQTSNRASASEAGKFVAKPEKRTWSRAGLPNMNDKDVLKAKIQEKQAANQLKIVKEQVTDLMGQLAKQKEQFSLMGSNTKTIGKNLRAELMGNINLLMAQLRNAQASMASAKTVVNRAKQALQTAIENSKSKPST